MNRNADQYIKYTQRNETQTTEYTFKCLDLKVYLNTSN